MIKLNRCLFSTKMGSFMSRQLLNSIFLNGINCILVLCSLIKETMSIFFHDIKYFTLILHNNWNSRIDMYHLAPFLSDSLSYSIPWKCTPDLENLILRTWVLSFGIASNILELFEGIRVDKISYLVFILTYFGFYNIILIIERNPSKEPQKARNIEVTSRWLNYWICTLVTSIFLLTLLFSRALWCCLVFRI